VKLIFRKDVYKVSQDEAYEVFLSCGTGALHICMKWG